MSLTAGTTLGPYTIVAPIGAGGMGEVYRAKDTRLDRDVAIKILPDRLASDPVAVARFEQEARAVAALSHPNILAIHDVGRDGATSFAVMELLDGVTLRDVIASGRLPLKKALEYGSAIAQGLAAAHAKGIVHRDLKPENVFVTRDGHVKILDFGLAKVEAATSSDRTTMAAKTDPGMVLGTIGYLSPEQAQGRAVDQRSDIFSFGAVLYELATGTRAFTGDSSIDTLHRIVHEEPKSVDELCAGAPHELKFILAKCLAKDPDDRYQSARDLIVDLRNASRVLDSSPRLAAAVASPDRPSGGWKIALIVAAAVVVLAIAAGLFWRGTRATESAGVRAAQTIERITSIGDVIDAVISPDGKYVAYVVSRSGSQGLWLRQLATASTLELVPAAPVGYWGCMFTPDGGAVYYVTRSKEHPEAALYRVPVLGGASRLVLTGLDSKPAFSPNGRQLVYNRADFPERGASSLLVADTDGANVRTLVTVRPPDFLAPVFYGAPGWSPDGAFVIAPVEHHTSTLSGSLAVYRVSDGAKQTFANADFPSLGQAAWMPDGHGVVTIGGRRGVTTMRDQNQVWFLSYPDGARRPITSDLLDYRDVSISSDGSALVTVAADSTSSLWMAPADGAGDARRITNGKYDGIDGLAGTPDKHILFTSVSNGEESVWLTGEDGSAPLQLTTNGASRAPALLPGGRTFYYARNGTELWQAGIDGQGAHLVKVLSSVWWPVVTPDGKWVYFSSAAQGLAELWKVAADGRGDPVRVVDDYVAQAAISPDGTKIAFFGRPRPGAEMKLAVMPIDGTLASIKTFDAYQWAWATVRWSSDGKALLHNAHSNDRSNVWLQPIDGGPARELTHFADQTLMNFNVTSDGKQLIIARGLLSRDALLIKNFK